MKNLSPLFFGILFVFTIVSCQKEYSNESGGVPVDPAATDLLIRAEVEDNSSKITCTYDYNGAGRIIKSLINLNAGTLNGDLKVEASRDASGRLTGAKLVISSTLNPAGDTANYQFVRNGTGRITAMTIKPNPNGGPLIFDSVVYTYNAANKIASYIYYSVIRNGGSVQIEPYQKFELTYSGENATQRKEYLLNGSVNNSELLETLNLQYDAKPATRIVTEEEYMLELAPINGFLPAVNNIVRMEAISAVNIDDNYTTIYAYIYGANDKPSSAQVTTTFTDGTESVSTMRFTYN